MSKITKTVAPKKAPVTSTTVKASAANKAVVSAKTEIPVVKKAAVANGMSAVEKHIKNFEPLELSEGLGFNAQKVYTVHNAWAKCKPLIEHLAKSLRGKLKAEFAELKTVLDSINPNPGA